MGYHDREGTPARFGQIPFRRGLYFTCLSCSRPSALGRDAALQAWGEQGIIADVARRLRCPYCRARGMRCAIAPFGATELASKSALARFVDLLAALPVSGKID